MVWISNGWLWVVDSGWSILDSEFLVEFGVFDFYYYQCLESRVYNFGFVFGFGLTWNQKKSSWDRNDTSYGVVRVERSIFDGVESWFESRLDSCCCWFRLVKSKLESRFLESNLANTCDSLESISLVLLRVEIDSHNVGCLFDLCITISTDDVNDDTVPISHMGTIGEKHTIFHIWL